MGNKNYPTISILTLTYNADISIWKKTLKALRRQKYPKANIEHLVMDGGSTNQTTAVAKKFGCKTYGMPELKDNSEGRKGLGIQKAKNELILFLETDNIMVGDDWLVRMVEPFVKEKAVIASYSMHNSSDRDMPALTRYCNLIGMNDPTVWYLDKSEKLTQFEKIYTKGSMISDNDRYAVVRFDVHTLPTLGDNGHMVRRSVIAKVNTKPMEFLHTDAFAKLLHMGYDTYGVVKNSIIHYSGSNILNLYKRRLTFKAEFFDIKQKKRIYYVFDKNSKKDRKNLLLFVIFSLTIIQPMWIAIRGYMIKPDPAWFIHPLVCLVATIAYGISEVSMVYHSFSKK